MGGIDGNRKSETIFGDMGGNLMVIAKDIWTARFSETPKILEIDDTIRLAIAHLSPSQPISALPYLDSSHGTNQADSLQTSCAAWTRWNLLGLKVNS